MKPYVPGVPSGAEVNRPTGPSDSSVRNEHDSGQGFQGNKLWNPDY